MGQAAHGSAPDIAGQDVANPFSLVLSAGMLLEWFGAKSGKADFVSAAQAISSAVAGAIESGECTADAGGRLGTRATGAALAQRLAASR
jgi:3-isopropylmalate dehydrogenase